MPDELPLRFDMVVVELSDEFVRMKVVYQTCFFPSG
jgi:hypothetical protein